MKDLTTVLTFVFALACGVASEATAQVCCPAGCVQNNNGCVTTGTNQRACQPVSCTPPPPPPVPGSPGGGQTYVQPILPLPAPVCFDMQPTQTTINEVTNNCISSLVANAQLIGCLFEDDAGKAEDKRTGLTCAQRQAALARQCNTRCAQFASASRTGPAQQKDSATSSGSSRSAISTGRSSARRAWRDVGRG